MLRPATDLAVVARHIGVEYDLRLAQRPTLRAAVADFALRKRRVRKKLWAIRDVSFALKWGEILGIVGRNGAGKTTLMTAVAGLIPVDEGAVRTGGRISTLLALGTGFDPDLSGRDNAYLNAAFLGIPKAVVTERIDEITEFSELGEFMDMPIRQYSSGMKSRLAFSIAVNLDPDILMLDEVLGVGDLAFSVKSAEKLHELMAAAKAMIVVTHSTPFVIEHCSRALWLDQGRVAAFGDPEAVVEAYTEYSTGREAPVRAVA